MRMTNDVRFTVRNRAASAKFKKEAATLLKEESKLAEELLAVYYPPEVMAQVAVLPDYLKVTQTRVQAYEGSVQLSLTFESPKLPLNTRFCIADVGISPPDSLVRRAEAFKEKMRLLHLRRSSFANSLDKILKSVTTTKKLIELMPEAAAWIPTVKGCSDVPVADKVAEFRKTF